MRKSLTMDALSSPRTLPTWLELGKVASDLCPPLKLLEHGIPEKWVDYRHRQQNEDCPVGPDEPLYRLNGQPHVLNHDGLRYSGGNVLSPIGKQGDIVECSGEHCEENVRCLCERVGFFEPDH